MKVAENIERLIRTFCETRKSQVATNAEMDKRVLDDAFGAYEKSQTKESGASQPNLWRKIMKSRITKLAAAVIIVTVLVGVSMFSGSDQPPKHIAEGPEGPNKELVAELENVEQMLAGGDIDGLVARLSESDFKTQVAAANYLAKMDGLEAIEVLEKLNAEYPQDDPANPFAPAVERIRSRVKLAQKKTATVVAKGFAPEKTKAASDAAVSLEQAKDTRAQLKSWSSDSSAKPEAANDEVSSSIVVEDTRTGPELVEGVSGYAYYFDGDGDYVDCGNDGSLELNAEGFSVGAWVNLKPSGRNKWIVAKGQWGSDRNGDYWLNLHPANSDLNFTIMTSRGIFRSAQYTYSMEQWYYVTGIFDGSSLCLYVNGQLVGDPTSVAGMIGTNEHIVQIGGDPSNHANINGSIDEVAVFNRVLSEAEIAGLYRNYGRLRGNESGLVGYWNFDNDDEHIVKDSSPYHNDGRLARGPDTHPELTEGASGKGYYFDGDGDYIEIPPIEGLSAEHTKMLWMYLEAWPLPSDVYLIDQDQGKQTGNNNWIELLDSDGNGVPNIRAGFDAGNFFDSNGNVEVGCWYHIAVVSTSAGDVFTYINALFDSSHSGFSASTQPKGILIGATSSDRRANFKGIIDEVAFFNRALSDEEIWQIYQNTGRLRGFEPGLVGYWNFDYDDGDIVRDSSPNGNHGKLGSADSTGAAGGSAPVIHGGRR